MAEETSESTVTDEEAPKTNAEGEQPTDEQPVSNEAIEQELEEMAKEEKSEEEKLAEQLAAWKEKALRATADLENYRKRMAREKAESIRFGNQNLLRDLLPVIDNFNMGMMAAEQDASSMIYMGMQMVQKQLDDFLNDQGVTTLAVKAGDAFDPNQHDAMSQEASEEIAEGHVIRVMRKGFMIGDRLLRPANVVVCGSENEEQEKTETSENTEKTEASEQN